MTDKPIHLPSATHPITVKPTGKHVTVLVNGVVVADTDNSLTLQEASYPAVQYIPMQDVAQNLLKPSSTTTYCPFKGDATYFHVTTASGNTVTDAIWTYLQPYPAVGDIAGHVAFYPDKAEITVA
jgi:uncharacterized protein (DUF427 family)